MKNILLITKILLLVNLIVLTSCVATKHNVGYSIKKDLLADIKIGETRKAKVKSMLGSPSSSSSYGDDTWYYISMEYESIAFLDPKLSSQRVIAIKFDEGEKVSAISEFTLDDNQKISYSEDTTKVEGREEGVLEQLVGNIGKFNPN